MATPADGPKAVGRRRFRTLGAGAAPRDHHRGRVIVRVGRLPPASCALILLLLSASPCWARDDDGPRFYFGLRGGESNPLTSAHDFVGFSLGVNFGRYLGAELSADFYELSLDTPAVGTIGELGVMALVPQLRWRYPVLQGRLTPYVVGGVGVGFTQFNDRKRDAFGLAVETESSALVGVVGAGIEYFVADNIAVGVEGKYLVSATQTVKVEGTRSKIDLDTALVAAGLRLFFPERERPAPAPSPSHMRVYLGVKVGGAIPVNEEIFPGVEARPEPPAYGGALDQLFGLALGVDFSRYAGVEISVDGYEMSLAMRGLGTFGEYAKYAVTPQLRLRYPLRDGRLEPYVLGGVGLGYAEYNDGKPPGARLAIKDSSLDVTGLMGVGIDYFVAGNIAVGLEAKYLISRGHVLAIDGGPEKKGNLDSVLLSLGLRVFLYGGRRS
jgi:opacity protein-like surface antigen